MNKVMVEIRIPAIGEHFDMFIPVDVPIRDLTGVIASGIAELTDSKYVPSKLEQLCVKESAGLLNPAYTLADYGIKDGMQLYFA